MADNQRQNGEILKFIKLIMSKKTKEELQLEVIKYLGSNHDILLEFLRSFSVNSIKNSKEAENASCSTVTSFYEADDNGNKSDGVKMEVASDVKKESSCGTQTSSKIGKSEYSRNDTSNNRHVTKKRRKSKYDYIQGDLSHIAREPKSRKYRDRSGNEMMIKNRTDQVQSQTECKDVKESDKLSTVHSMMETLLHAKSKQQRDEVLSSLRTDPALRDLFMKEKARMGKLKIPVFQDSSCKASGSCNTQVYDSGCKETKERANSSSSGVTTDADIKNTNHLIQAVHSIIRSRGSDLPYDNIAFNIDDMHFITSQASLEEPAVGADCTKELITTDDAAVTCIQSVHTISPQTSTIADTSIPFFHILSSDNGNDKMTENFYGSNGAVFDHALHEHFQQLACDQYSVNNPFIMNNNPVGSEVQHQRQTEQLTIIQSEES